MDLTATNVNTHLSLSVLHTNLSHPARLFAFYAPQLWQHPAVVMAAIGALLILAIAASVTTRRWAPAAAAITFLVTLLVDPLGPRHAGRAPGPVSARDLASCSRCRSGCGS